MDESDALEFFAERAAIIEIDESAIRVINRKVYKLIFTGMALAFD